MASRRYPSLGEIPEEAVGRRRWEARARTVAAYRDRYEVTDPHDPLGPATSADRQRDAARELAAAAPGVDVVERRRSPLVEAPVQAVRAPGLKRQTLMGR